MFDANAGPENASPAATSAVVTHFVSVMGDPPDCRGVRPPVAMRSPGEGSSGSGREGQTLVPQRHAVLPGVRATEKDAAPPVDGDRLRPADRPRRSVRLEPAPLKFEVRPLAHEFLDLDLR